MQGQGSGSIINISWTYGYEGAAGAGSFRQQARHRVSPSRWRSRSPSLESGQRRGAWSTDTGMLTRFTRTPENKTALMTGVPMGRLGLTEELANAIVFIASDEASYITGHVLNVDGGKTAG